MYDPAVLTLCIEHCDRMTASLMAAVPPVGVIDATLQNPNFQTWVNMQAQAWNMYWAQIIAGLGTLGAALPDMSKPVNPVRPPTTPPAAPTVPPVIPPATGGTTTVPPLSTTAAAVSLQQLVASLASQGLSAAALAAAGLK